MTQEGGFTIRLNPLALFRTQAPETPEEGEKDPKKGIAYNNEFSEIYHEFVNDIAIFRDKYPLTSLITMVFFAFLGISSFFSFSFTSMISCVLYCTTSYCLAKSIGNKGTAFWTNIKNSLFEVFQASSRKAPEKKDPEKS